MAEKDENQPEITPVGPGAEDLQDEIVVNDDEKDEGQETRADEEDGSDERTGHDEDGGGDREAIRARRREEKKRKKEQRNRDRLELNYLRQRNEQLERRFSQMEVRQSQNETVAIDSRISGLEQQIAEAERIHAAAVKKGDGESATEALRIRDQLREGVTQLKEVKTRAEVASRQPRRTAPDPEIVRRAREWLSDNSDWFDPNLRDEDSIIAKAIEDGLFREGRLDARTDDYWEEYNRRLKKRLPHLFEEDEVDERNGKGKEDEDQDEDEERSEKQKRTPRGPRLTTGGRERPLKKNEVYVDPERRKAMEEAGVWDDPQLRAKYLKQYQKYDQEHGRRR